MDRITITFRPRPDIVDLQRQWRDLETRADGGFFLSWDWIGCWLDAIGRDVILLEGRLRETVVALAVLCPKKTASFQQLAAKSLYLHETGDPQIDGILIEYNGFLVDRSLGDGVVDQCLDAVLKSEVIGGIRWDKLCCRGVGDEFAAALERSGLAARQTARDPVSIVDLEQIRRAGGDYLSGLSTNTRQQIRRSMRRYEARGALHAEAAAGVAQGLEFFEALGDLHQAYWQGRGAAGAFANPFFVTFHRRLIESGLPRGTVELLRISAGDTPIAYLYNFLHRGTVNYYTSGFAYESDNRMKPGLVGHAMAIERSLAMGRDLYDFLAGAARYKTSLGDPGPGMSAFELRRPGVKQIVSDTLHRAMRVAVKR